MNKVEKARIDDVTQMHKLITGFADKGEMLARPLSEIYENIRDYFVVRDGNEVIACVALHLMWGDLAEIKSLAVAEDNQRQGLGNQLIEACIKDARELGIPTVLVECDLVDERTFSEGQVMTRMDAFAEQILKNLDAQELPRSKKSQDIP